MKRRTAFTLATFFLAIITVATARAAPGDIDPTFGQGGKVVTTVAVPGYTYYYPITESMLVQPDGKILVCGRFYEDGTAAMFGTMIVRYMPDGSLDTSFGENGKVAVIGPGFINDNKAVGRDMALQPDGKIVLIGSVGIAYGVIVQRYTPSGTLDATFGTGGSTVLPAGGRPAFPMGASLALQPDGKIVGTGWEYYSYWDIANYYDAIITFRLNVDGSLDTSFGGAGTGILRIVDGYDGSQVVLQPDGRVLVVGSLLNFRDVLGAALFVRYNSDGSLDPSFGTGGRVSYRINDQISYFGRAALQSDGKIVVVGSTRLGMEYRLFIARFASDGSLDGAFGTQGIYYFDGLLESANTIFFDSEDRIIVTGYVHNDANNRPEFAIARIKTNGSPDTSFGTQGRAAFPVDVGGNNYAYASDGAMQADGKILLAGSNGYYPPDPQCIALIRVNGGDAAASGATVSGRVTAPSGQGLRSATVVLTPQAGTERTATTSSFGLYSFDGVAIGEAYTITVRSRRYRFTPRSLQVTGSLTGVDLVGQE